MQEGVPPPPAPSPLGVAPSKNPGENPGAQLGMFGKILTRKKFLVTCKATRNFPQKLIFNLHFASIPVLISSPAP